MPFHASRLVAVLAASLIWASWSYGDADPAARRFSLDYQATITGLKPGQKARIWLPVPSSSEDQDVRIVRTDLPADERIGTEPKFGNRILYAEATASPRGEIHLGAVYRVVRREAGREPASDRERAAPDRFLKPDARVPVGGKSLKLLADHKPPDDPMARARLLYDLVDGHMRYSKEGVGWGQGDADWACTSGFGNCTDFHSVFMSLARAENLPVKFEIGFSLPPKRGEGEIAGYHCWAKFMPDGKTWVPVDISEANKNPRLKDYFFGRLTPDRVAMSVGRDLDLVPRQAGPPLNFFVFPYAEVDGRPYPADKVRTRVAYRDE